MLAKLRPRLTYANVMATIAVFGVLSTGGAYAANTIGSSDVIDESLLSMDLKNGQVMTNDLGTFAVTNNKLAPNAINHAKVQDFNLTNQDVGVLFAEVTSVATLASSSGGTVTVTRVGDASAGRYEVDFGRSIQSCAAVATIGYHSTAVSSPGETVVADRTGNAEAVLVVTHSSAGTPAPKPFRLVVVC